MTGVALASIPFDMPTRAFRENITVKEPSFKAIDQAARAGGQSRSAYLAEAARARIRATA